jgi:WD40 repeat protein
LIGFTYGERICVRRTEENLDMVGEMANDNVKHFTGLAFHPSGRYLAATSKDATVKLYDTASWQLATTLTWDIGRMRSIAFSPNGTLAAAGSDTGRIVVWDLDV